MSAETNFEEVRNCIMQIIVDEYPDLEIPEVIVGGGMPARIVFDNEDYTPKTECPWVRFSVRNGGSYQDTIGPAGQRWFVRDGYIFANIYIPPLIGGTSGLDSIATEIRKLYEGKKLGTTSIRFEGASLTEQDVVEGKSFEGVLRIDFTYDQLL